MANLDGVHLKIARARHHFDHLKQEIKAFNDRHPYATRHEIDPETGFKHFVYYPTEQIPTDWPLIIGELVYDLRSALDHVVFGIGGANVTRSEFPIFDDKGLFFEKVKKTGEPSRRSGLYKMRGVTKTETRAVIQGVQPFHPLPEGQISTLWMLSELCNIDKHRTLHLCRRDMHATEIRWVRDVTFSGDMTINMITGPMGERAVLASWNLLPSPTK